MNRSFGVASHPSPNQWRFSLFRKVFPTNSPLNGRGAWLVTENTTRKAFWKLVLPEACSQKALSSSPASAKRLSLEPSLPCALCVFIVNRSNQPAAITVPNRHPHFSPALIEASTVQSSQPRLLRLSSHVLRQSFLLIKGFGALPAAGSSAPAFAPGIGDVWTTVSIRLRISWFSEHSWLSPLLYIRVFSQHRDAVVGLFQGPTLFPSTTATFWE